MATTMKKAPKAKVATPANPVLPDPVDYSEVEQAFGHTRATQYWEPIDRMDREEREDAQAVEAIGSRRVTRERERAFYRGRLRAAMDAVAKVDIVALVTPILSVKVYDQDLRFLLDGVGQKARLWEEFVGGATDNDIIDNIGEGYSGYEKVANGYVLLTDQLMGGVDDRRVSGITLGDTKGIVVLEAKALVAEVRRILSIPPAATPAKPAAKKAKATTAPKGTPAKAPKKTAGDGFDAWARAAKKAMRRKGGDAALVKAEEPWTHWHAEGKGPADAVKAWVAGQDATLKELARVGAAKGGPDLSGDFVESDPERPKDPSGTAAQVLEMKDVELWTTWEAVMASFSGTKIHRGDPAKVESPVRINGVPYLFMGILKQGGRELAKLVKLLPESDLTPTEAKAMKDAAQGYSGRTVQSPAGVRYLVAPEVFNLLIAKPVEATGPADGKVG